MSAVLKNTTTNLVRFFAEIVLTFGLIVLLFAFYLLFWTGQRTAMAQEDLLQEFRQSSATQQENPKDRSRRPSVGDAIAVIHIPKFGDQWSRVVLEGVEPEDLRDGPGRFPETAMPGQVGNFAVAGHRSGYGEPFAELDQLAEGDQIVVETANAWLTYAVTWNQVMPATAVEVLEPVAGHPGVKATQRTMTLVTCHPRWSSTERLVVGAQLVERRTADAGPPPGIA